MDLILYYKLLKVVQFFVQNLCELSLIYAFFMQSFLHSCIVIFFTVIISIYYYNYYQYYYHIITIIINFNTIYAITSN